MINLPSGYTTLTTAKERIYTTLYVIDNDMQEWKSIQTMIGKDSTNNRAQKELHKEMKDFFDKSANIRKQLTLYLSLFDAICEN